MDDNGGEWVQQTVDGNSFWYYYNSNGDMVTGWIKSDGYSYYCYSDGTMARDTMVNGYYVNNDGQCATDEEGSIEIIDGNNNHFWYYIGPGGKAVTGWNKVGENFHYYNYPGGSMTWDNTIDGFYLDSYGNLAGGTGWLKDKYSGNWYYYSDGSMQTGWIQDGDNWYYLKDDGSMATGWFEAANGDWYYLQSDGSMATGWVEDDTGWYFLYNNGSMARGYTTDDGYHVDESGKMITGTGWVSSDGFWYYLNDTGKVVTNWLQDQGNWYYLYPKGSMAKDTWVNGYYVDDSGKWITDTNKYSDDEIIPVEIHDNTNGYSMDDADQYINTNISVFGTKIPMGRKTYFANEISDLPKEISYKSGRYTYTYTLQEIPITEGVFGSGPIYGDIITTKDGTIINNKEYAYILSYTNEPQMSIGVVYPISPEMPVEGIGGKVAANEAVDGESNPKYSNQYPEDITNNLKLAKQLKIQNVDGKYKIVNEQLANGQCMTAKGDYIYVIKNDGEVVFTKNTNYTGHVNLTGGDDVMYAGEMRFTQSGKLKYWNNASGHYLPDAEDAGKVIDILKNSGLDDISMDNFVPRE